MTSIDILYFLIGLRKRSRKTKIKQYNYTHNHQAKYNKISEVLIKDIEKSNLINSNSKIKNTDAQIVAQY
jgi:hypothetical protein